MQTVGGFVSDLVERARNAPTLDSCSGSRALSACAPRWTMLMRTPGQHRPGDRRHHGGANRQQLDRHGTTALPSGERPLDRHAAAGAYDRLTCSIRRSSRSLPTWPRRCCRCSAVLPAAFSVILIRPGGCCGMRSTLLLPVLSDNGGLAARQCTAGSADTGRLSHQPCSRRSQGHDFVSANLIRCSRCARRRAVATVGKAV